MRLKLRSQRRGNHRQLLESCGIPADCAVVGRKELHEVGMADDWSNVSGRRVKYTKNACTDAGRGGYL